MHYDLIILGGGPAGYLAAERAAQGGFSTLLIEKRNLGGVCLNEGCIPSKAFLHCAKVYDYAKHALSYGVTVTGASLDHDTVLARKNKVVRTLVAGVEGKMRKHQVTVLKDEAKIRGRSSQGFEVEAAATLYTSKRLLIATGSVPIVPPIPGLQEGLASGLVLTNREILDLAELPKELVIIGGGAIGLEMASYFNSAGSQVTVVEMLPQIAGATDQEISAILLKNYQKKGVRFHVGAKVTTIGQSSVDFEKEGTVTAIAADKVLLSIGRRPATEGLGLETLGVEMERGCIKTDIRGRTSVPEVYAAGDVNGISMLAHTAYREAEVCVHNMLGQRDQVRYDTIPSVIYTNPEVASIGETEASAKAKGLEVEIAKLPMNYSGRYVAEQGVGDGLIKVVVDKRHRKLLGVQMIGPYTSEMIFGVGTMMEAEMRIADIRELVFPHPTVSEVLHEVLYELP